MNEFIADNVGNNVIDGEKINAGTIDRKEFMRQVGIGFGAIMLMNCLQSCGDGGEIPDPNPTANTKLDFTIDLKTNDFSSLKTKGNFAVVKTQNVIVAHTNADTWIAVDAKCTHEQTIINYRAASNDFLCPNHGSVFTATGSVTTGPATQALTKYFTSFDATNSTLRVFS